MAWTTINHSCGHTEQHQLYGPGRDRERKAAWMAKDVCSDCRASDLAKANAEAADAASEIGFAPLTGSDKQVAWATKIRLDYYNALIEAYGPNVVDGRNIAAEFLSVEIKAGWWIDHKSGYRPEEIISLLKQSYPVVFAQLAELAARRSK